MHLTYTNTNRTITLETDVAGSTEAFEALAEFGEVFDETACGNCASVNVRFDVRRPKGFVYYCLVCRDCGCRLDVSKHKEEQGGGLYVDRKDDAGNPKPNGGWYRYQADGERAAPRTAARTRKQDAATPIAAAKEADQEPDAYMGLIAAAKHKGTLTQVGEAIAADETVATGRRNLLRAAYESRLHTLNRTK